jgi:hypothetical protein
MQRSIKPEMGIFAKRHFRICGTVFKQIAKKKEINLLLKNLYILEFI